MKNPGYMVSLNVNIPRLGTIEVFDSPRYFVEGPVDFMFPPGKWMETMRQWYGGELTLQMFVKDENDILLAKQLLAEEFVKIAWGWTSRLKDWEGRFEERVRKHLI